MQYKYFRVTCIRRAVSQQFSYCYLCDAFFPTLLLMLMNWMDLIFCASLYVKCIKLIRPKSVNLPKCGCHKIAFF